MIKSLTIPWGLVIKGAIAAAVFGSGMGAGMTLQALRESGARAALALDLAACRGADAEASRKALERATRTVEANTVRQSQVTGDLVAGAEAFRQLQERPREIVTRIECLATDDDADRQRVLYDAFADPDHRD